MANEPIIPDLLNVDGFDVNAYMKSDVNKKKGEAQKDASPEKQHLKKTPASPRKTQKKTQPILTDRMHVIRLSSSVFAKLKLAKLINFKLTGEDGSVSDFIDELIDNKIDSMPANCGELLKKLSSLE